MSRTTSNKTFSIFRKPKGSKRALRGKCRPKARPPTDRDDLSRSR